MLPIGKVQAIQFIIFFWKKKNNDTHKLFLPVSTSALLETSRYFWLGAEKWIQRDIILELSNQNSLAVSS